MVPETRLYKWVQRTIDDQSIVGCMLLQPPFEDVVVQFDGNVDIQEYGISFIWRIVGNPNNAPNLTSSNTEFAKYLQRVVNDRLDEAKGVSNDVEIKNIDNSGTC